MNWLMVFFEESDFWPCIFCYLKKAMDKNKDKSREDQKPSTREPVKHDETKPRSSAFNEPGPDAQKSTLNTETADMEQDRKDAMTERD